MLLVTAPPPVEASTPTEAVAVVALDDGVARDALAIDRMVRRWVDRSALVDLMDLGEHAQGPALDELRSRVERARSVKAAGVEAYDMMSYEQALMRLERAIESYEQSDLTQHLDELLDAYFMRALALFYEGQPSRARNQLLDIFALSREFQPDRGRVTPEIETLLDEARRSVDEAPPTTLEIQTDPVPGLIYVDGRYRGISPVELTNLQPGHHFVSVRAPGYAFTQERHLAAPGQIARVRLDSSGLGRDLRARLEAIRIALQGNNPSSAAVRLLEWAGADQALVLGVRRRDENTMALVAFRFASDGHLMAHGEARMSLREAEEGAALSAFLDRLYGQDRPRGPAGEPVPELSSPLSFDFSFDRRSWGVVAGGAGVASAVGGVFLGLSASRQAADARTIPQLDVEDYREAMRLAKRRALLADGLYLTAAVGVATGIYLFVVKDEPGLQGQALMASPSVDGLFLSFGGRF